MFRTSVERIINLLIKQHAILCQWEHCRSGIMWREAFERRWRWEKILLAAFKDKIFTWIYGGVESFPESFLVVLLNFYQVEKSGDRRDTWYLRNESNFPKILCLFLHLFSKKYYKPCWPNTWDFKRHSGCVP